MTDDLGRSGLREYAEQWPTGTGVLIPPTTMPPPPARVSPKPGQGPVGQGTRASLAQGTGQPKDAPTHTQFGDAGTKPNTQGLRRFWPLNRVIESISPSPGRSHQLRTDYELQVQPAPGRILRQLWTRNQGVIGDDLMASFPYDAAWSLIPHQFVPRRPQGTGPLWHQSDDNAPIPAIYAGNPRPTR